VVEAILITQYKKTIEGTRLMKVDCN
jgi:hypothetical protein